MKTLRAKLFVSIGTVFLLSGILNTISSEIWIKKDLNKVGTHINKRLEEIQDRIRAFSSFILTFHIIQEVTELDRVVLMIGKDSTPAHNSTLWEQASNILSYNPNIAFIQIQNNQGENVVISPEDAPLVSFSWAFDLTGTLWIKLKEPETLFKTTSYEKNNQIYYLLSEPISSSNTSHLHFVTAPLPDCSYEWQESASHLFYSLLSCKHNWLQKMEFIQELLPLQEQSLLSFPAGIVKIDPQKNLGSCLLTHGLFSKTLLIEHVEKKETEDIPALILRNTSKGSELDMIKSLSTNSHEIITVGFSLSSLLLNISHLAQKTIIATGDNFAIGFTPLKNRFNLEEHPDSFNSLLQNKDVFPWEGISYVFSSIDLQILKLFILTPQEQATSTSRFLYSVSTTLREKISFILIGTGLFSFLIALVLLHNISKKITDPIALLSHAAETLGKGGYTNLILPKFNHRVDEIATFVHSFEGMIASLKDRDKIHGLLNKVVSKEISEKILEQSIELEGEEKVVTLLFSDIRNFTQIAEKFPPRSLINILNAYMTRMCLIIDNTHGVVDKFIGDAIMALYGAPVPLDDHAVKAIEAALAMKEDLSSWNKEREENNLPIFEIGIGIHTGLVYTGNMGAENRLNYTAIGSNVNQASRICSIAKPMQILISKETLQAPHVQEKFQVQKLDPILLKGIQIPIQLYEVLAYKK